MNFFEIRSRQEYASYSAEQPVGEIEDKRIMPPCRLIAGSLEEYLGVPPRKPGKRGDMHVSSSLYYVRSSVVPLFEQAAKGKILTKPLVIKGREDEEFVQIWVLNFVDCLDLKATVSAPPGSAHKRHNMIGPIKRAAFDESRWDGSDLFVVPQNPSFTFFCTERFVDQWRQAKLKGAQFSRYLFDPEPILA